MAAAFACGKCGLSLAVFGKTQSSNHAWRPLSLWLEHCVTFGTPPKLKACLECIAWFLEFLFHRQKPVRPWREWALRAYTGHIFTSEDVFCINTKLVMINLGQHAEGVMLVCQAPCLCYMHSLGAGFVALVRVRKVHIR